MGERVAGRALKTASQTEAMEGRNTPLCKQKKESRPFGPILGDTQNRRKRNLTHEWAHEWVHEWPHESAHESPHDSTHEG